MGLLDKARVAQTRENPVPAAVETASPESDFIRVINELTALEPGLDYGAVLFSRTVQNLAIEKGALFLQSGDGHDYYCLCNRGYDKTTNSRLRLEKNFFSHPSVQSGFEKSQPFTVKAPCPFLKDYFSNREYGLIEEIHIIPFNHNNSLFSLMLITEWSELIPLEWKALMAHLSLNTSEILYNSRLALVSPDDSEYSGTPEIRKIISGILEEKPEQEMLFIRLSLDELLKELTGSAGGLSAVNIKQEILAVFKTMSGGSAGILELDRNRVLLILEKERIPNRELYLHQLSSSLPLLYKNLEFTPDLNSEIFLYPDEWTDRESFLGAIL